MGTDAEASRVAPPAPIGIDGINRSQSAPHSPNRRRKLSRDTYQTEHLTKGYVAVEAGRTVREARGAANQAEREARIREMVAELRQDLAPEVQEKTRPP